MQALQILSFLLVLTVVSANIFEFIDKELLRQSVNCSTDAGGLNTPSAQPLQACEWYKDNTCCTPENALAFQTYVDSFVDKQKYKDCYDYLSLWYCASCSPKSADYFYFYKGEDFVICKSFCNKLADACIGVPSSIEGEGTIVSPDIKQTYCIDLPESGRCFNSANSISVFALLIVFAIFL